MGLEALEQPIFGKAKAEWLVAPNSAPPPRAYLFHMQMNPSSSSISVHSTDFHLSTFEAVLSIEQLEDLRDVIGIGGSWTDFINYFAASLKSDEVKLILEGKPSRDGATRAKIVAQRSKGMPLISIPLGKLVDSSAMDAMANLSLELYKAFKSRSTNSTLDNQVAKIASTENENIEAVPKMGDKAKYSYASSLKGLQDSPEKVVAQVLRSSKVAKRAVPTYRSAKKRGARLQDTEDGADE